MREELAQPRLDRIGGLTVAMPQGLRLGTRRLGHALPPLLDVVELARRLVEVFFLGTLRRVEAEPGAQRLGPGDQLLLHRRVGEAFPLVHLAQVVHARCDDGGGSLEPLEQRRLLFLLDRRRRVDRAAEIAREPIGLAQREVFGGAALLRPLDQLLDALQLLTQRPLFGRVLVFGALRDARHGLLVALRDRFVQTLRARHERGPFGGRRGPRLARQRLFAAQALRLARQFREAGVRLLHVELVLMALPRGGNGRLELRPERAHRGIVFRGAERFPFAGRLFDLLERVLAANALDLLDHRRTAGVQRGAPLVFGPALRFHALVLRDAAARPARRRLEARHAVRFELERRFGRQRRPLALGALQFLRRALGGRRNRFDASHQARHPLLPRLECDTPCGLRLVQCLHHCPRPL